MFNNQSPIRSRWYRSIKVRLLLFGITMSILPLLLLGLYSIHTARNDLERSIHKQHAIIAVRLAHETADMVGTLRTSLETIAMAESLRLFHEPQVIRERLLYTIMNRYPLIEELTIVTHSGQELTRVSRRYPVGPNDLHQITQHPGFSEILQNQPYVGAAQIEPDNQVVFTLAIPVAGSTGKSVQGGLIAHVSLRSVMEQISSQPIGEGGYIFLVDGTGALIGHEDFSQVLRRQNVIGSRAVQELLAGYGSDPEPAPARYVSYTGQEVLGVYTRVRGTDWGVIIEQPAITAYSPLWGLIMKLSAAMISVIAIAITLSIFFAFFFMRPLDALAEGVRKVTSGNLGYKIPGHPEDELGKVIQAFNHMTAELQYRHDLETAVFQAEKMTAIGMLAAGVAHEINNPMNTLAFYATDLEERLQAEGPVALEKSGDMQHYLDTIRKQITRCTTITHSLLNFAKPHAEEITAVSTEQILQDTLPLLNHRLRKQNITLQLSFADTLPRVHADSARLQQVFVNLLSNALDAMPQGGCLQISAITVPSFPTPLVRIVVADTGPGIPESNMQQIFQPFFTTKPVGQGTGLGLSICYSIISRFQGRIYAENNMEKGTRIIVELPAVQEEC